MKPILTQRCFVHLGFAAALAALQLPVMAAAPGTGDRRVLGWVLIALGISLIVIIALVLFSAWNKRRGK